MFSLPTLPVEFGSKVAVGNMRHTAQTIDAIIGHLGRHVANTYHRQPSPSFSTALTERSNIKRPQRHPMIMSQKAMHSMHSATHTPLVAQQDMDAHTMGLFTTVYFDGDTAPTKHMSQIQDAAAGTCTAAASKWAVASTVANAQFFMAASSATVRLSFSSAPEAAAAM
eukprot:535459-Amphidinium_carterae.1